MDQRIAVPVLKFVAVKRDPTDVPGGCLFYTAQLQFFARQVNFNIRNALSNTTAPLFNLDQAARAGNNIINARALTRSLLYGDQALLTRPLLQRLPGAEAIWAHYACFPNDGFYYEVPACEAYRDGMIAKQGLLPAMTDYLLNAQSLVDKINANPLYLTSMSSGAASVIQNWGVNYFPLALSKFFDVVYAAAISDLDAFNTLDLCLTVASCLVLIALYYALYRPQVRQLDKEIKNVRNLLLLFPDEVSRNTQAIIAAGRDMMREANETSRGASGGSVISSR